MKKIVQRISASFSKGALFGLGILFSGVVLAALNIPTLIGGLDNDKVDGDTVSADDYNAIVTSIQEVVDGLVAGCSDGKVMKGLKNDGTADCISVGGGGGGDPLLDAPEGFGATVTETQGVPPAPSTVTIDLSWSDVTGATGYELVRLATAPASGGSVDLDGTVQSVPGLSYSLGNAAKKTHYFKVRAVGGQWSSVLPVTATTVPGIPTNVNLASIQGGSAGVSWTAPSDNGGMPIVAYEIRFTPTGDAEDLNDYELQEVQFNGIPYQQLVPGGGDYTLPYEPYEPPTEEIDGGDNGFNAGFGESWTKLTSFFMSDAHAAVPLGAVMFDGSPPTIVSVSGQSTSYISTGIPAGTYTVAVRAVNAVGTGSWASGGSEVIINTPAMPALYMQEMMYDNDGGLVQVGAPIWYLDPPEYIINPPEYIINPPEYIINPPYDPGISPIFPGDLADDNDANGVADILEPAFPTLPIFPDDFQDLYDAAEQGNNND
ncbi:fibronectin type III domain-containing protein [Candidatus Gracilibacteria bacterium]|nr:fibronectin type III domain-containing protein [Candidatus Gracilibacteria bacterium]